MKNNIIDGLPNEVRVQLPDYVQTAIDVVCKKFQCEIWLLFTAFDEMPAFFFDGVSAPSEDEFYATILPELPDWCRQDELTLMSYGSQDGLGDLYDETLYKMR